MTINNNANFNNNSFNDSTHNNADNNGNSSDNWTQAFNREVAQRQMEAMMEQVMAIASQVQQQMQAQMQQRMQSGAPQGFGFPGMGTPSAMPQDVLRDAETALIISLTLPGLQEESVKLAVKDQVLQVTGQLDAAAVLPPGFPAPPALGFTRLVQLPVAVDSDRPTITTTETGISIILPKMEPGTLTDEQLRQLATPPAAANPMAGVVEAMLNGTSSQGMPFPFAPRPSTRQRIQQNLNRWNQEATQTFRRWGTSLGQWLVEMKAAQKVQESDRTAQFIQQSDIHDQLMTRWTDSRRWMGQQLKTLGDRLSQ